MIRERIVTMLLIFGSAAGVVAVLLLNAAPGKVATHGFVRRFGEVEMLPAVDTLDLKFNSFYIAGKAKDHLYFGNVVTPQWLLEVDVASLASESMKLQVPEVIEKGYRSITVRVDSPDYYLADGSMPFIYRGHLEGGINGQLLEDKVYFLDFLPLDSNSFALRSITGDRDGRLGMLRVKPFDIKYPPGLLKRQVDGLLCTDGMMHYDSPSGTLIYLYRYRNQFLVMDASLQLRYKGTTIDTNTVAKIEVATIRSTNSITFSSPPLVVNKESCVQGNRLYILSPLMADNEEATRFRHVSVIDVYGLDRCEYLFSFYLPDYEEGKVGHFECFGHRVIAQYADKVVSYALVL